jgi:hypothetical protein
MQSAVSIPKPNGLLERIRTKWQPLRVKKTRQVKNLEPRFDSIETEKALMQTMLVFVASETGLVTADQPDEFLRVHLVAVTIAGILQRHRAAIGDLILLFRKFGGYPDWV